MTLPQALLATAFVDIAIIPTGTITLPEYTLHKDGGDKLITIPVYAFLIEHEALGKKAFFDLGVPKVSSLFKAF